MSLKQTDLTLRLIRLRSYFVILFILKKLFQHDAGFFFFVFLFFFLWRAGEGEVQCQHVQTDERDAHIAKCRPNTKPCVKAVEFLSGEIILTAYPCGMFLSRAL